MGMGDRVKHPRRTFLKTATTAGLAGIAGCMGGDDGDDGGGGDGGGDGSDGGDGGSTETETPVVNDELEEVQFAFLEGASAGIVTNILLAEGMDAEHNLHIDFRKMGLNEAQQALYRNQVQMSAVGPIPTARANSRSGVDITIISPVITLHHAMLVKPDSSYESIEDLVGQRISSFPRQSSSFNTYALLMDELGYSWEDDFELTLTSTINILNLFERGDVEAMTHFEPFVTRWIAPGDARELADMRQVYEETFGRPQQFASVAASTELVENEPSKVIKTHRAYMDTLRLIQEDTERIIDRYGNLYGFETDAQLELAKERIPPIYLPRWDDEVIESGKEDIRRSIELGLLNSDAPTDIFWQPPEGA